MGATFTGPTTMRTALSSQTLGPPLASSPRLARAARQFHTPLVHGSLATATEKKVRAGTQPPMPAMAGMIDRHAANGGTMDAPLGFAIALIHAIYERWGVSLATCDVEAAVAAETEAEGAANRYDIRACAWRSLTLPEKKAYEIAAWKNAEASRVRAFAVTAQIARDEFEAELVAAQMRTLRHA